VHTIARRRSIAPFALAVTLITAFLVLFTAHPASAHDSLVASDPAADSTVDTLPTELTLTFSAKLIDGDGATEVVVTDPTGASVTDGPATVDGAMVTQPLATAADAGSYHVIWKVVSSDGHPTSGEFSFTVATGTATAAPTADPTPTAAPSEEATSPASSSEPTPSSTDGTPADRDSFLGVLPWIIVLVVGVAGAGAIVAVLMARARRNGPEADSDAAAEG